MSSSREMNCEHFANEALDYIKGFKWCPDIELIRQPFCIAGILAVHFIKFKVPIEQDDDKLWVIVGDLPCAYVVFESGDTPRVALEKYCFVMSEWCDAVDGGLDMETVYPIDADPSQDNSNLLRKRIAFLRSDVIVETPNRFKIE